MTDVVIEFKPVAQGHMPQAFARFGSTLMSLFCEKNMKLLVMSDLHLDFEDLRVPETDADVIVLAGDLCDGGLDGIHWARKTWPFKTILIVPGNHDFFGYGYNAHRKHLRLMRDSYHNVFLLDRDYLVLDGVLFVGATLWTDFLFDAESENDIVEREAAMANAARFMADYYLIKHGGRRLMPEDTRQFFFEDYRYLRRMLVNSNAEFAQRHNVAEIRKKVVITHHAPSARSVSDQYRDSPYNGIFASRIDHTVALADIWIHGHMHTSCDYEIERDGRHLTRVVCNPRGVFDGESDENPTFDPRMIIDV